MQKKNNLALLLFFICIIHNYMHV